MNKHVLKKFFIIFTSLLVALISTNAVVFAQAPPTIVDPFAALEEEEAPPTLELAPAPEPEVEEPEPAPVEELPELPAAEEAPPALELAPAPAPEVEEPAPAPAPQPLRAAAPEVPDTGPEESILLVVAIILATGYVYKRKLS